MKLIVGLGNPGPQYTYTRHNIGRRVVEAFVPKTGNPWKTNRTLRARFVEWVRAGVPVVVATPDSFMNESGESVRRLADHFAIDFKTDLLVVVDDAALPFGRLRLRPDGQYGGHRGLQSIEETLQSRIYARLRVGIAPSVPLREPLEKYVLAPFPPQEEKALPKIIERSVETCSLWILGPVEKAMDFANQPLETDGI